MKALLQDPRKRIWLGVASLVVTALVVVLVVVAYSHGGGGSQGYSY